MRLVLLPALAIAIVALPARAAEKPEVRYTDLTGKACRFVSGAKTADDDAVKRCPGHGGAEVETLAGHTRLRLSYRFSESQVARDVVVAWSAGKTLEWRGLKTNKGFQPYATILRLLLKDPESARPEADGQVLAVMRFDPREAEACVIAYVDAQANKDPNRLARTIADRDGPTFDCESDEPKVVGAETRWTAELMKPRRR
jgi:hypothetical protein